MSRAPPALETRQWVVTEEADDRGHVRNVGLGPVRLPIVDAGLANSKLRCNILLEHLQRESPLAKVISDRLRLDGDSEHLARRAWGWWRTASGFRRGIYAPGMPAR